MTRGRFFHPLGEPSLREEDGNGDRQDQQGDELRFLQPCRPDAVLPEEGNAEPPYSIQGQVQRKQHPVRLQPAPQLPYDRERQDVPDHLVGYRGVDPGRIAVSAVPRGCLGVGPLEPEQQVGRLRAVLPVDDVADAADGLDVEQRGRGQVGDNAHWMLGDERVRGPAYESAQDSAPHAYAAGPDLQHLHGVLGVHGAPVVDYVHHPGTYDSAYDRPDGDGEHHVRVNLLERCPPRHEHDGGGHCDEAEQAVPAEGQLRYEVRREQEGAYVYFYHGYLAAQILRMPSLAVKELYSFSNVGVIDVGADPRVRPQGEGPASKLLQQ